MDRHFDPINNCVSREFKEGVDVLIAFASNQNSFIEGKTMLCPCARCQNRKQRDSRTVSTESDSKVIIIYGQAMEKITMTLANHRREIFALHIMIQMCQICFTMKVDGKMEQRHLTDDDYTVLQTFLMLNCLAFEPYERMFEEFMMDNKPNMCGDDLQIAKDNHYAEWVKNYVSTSSNDWWACTKVVPRGVREISEDALTALQDDTHNQVVAPSEMLRFETYVVEDDSDYDSTPVHPPNDGYVSEDELEPSCTDSDSGSDSNVRNVRPQLRAASMPPARTPASSQPTRPPGVVGSSTSSAAPPPPPPPPPPTYATRIDEALLRAPTRINQPHLHPDKINGAWWIGVDPEVYEFIKSTWQGNFWGPWQSWLKVPVEKRTSCNNTTGKTKFMKKSTSNGSFGLNQKRPKNKQPSYVSATDWETILANWSTAEAKAKSQSAAESRCAAPPGLKMHVHGAGPRTFAIIAYNMVVEEGLEGPVSYPDLVRKTHCRKDGTFLDERAEALILEVEQAVEEMLQDGSPLGDSQTESTAATRTSKCLLLNEEYIKRGQTRMGTIYGLGNLQYKNKRPSESVPAALNREINMETRVSGLETLTQEIKSDVHALKTGFNEGTARTQSTLNMILQLLQPQAFAAQASQSQHHSPSHSAAQPQGQAQPEGHGQAPTPPHDQPQAPGDAQPQHLITTNNSALDRWCNELGL
ncbi:LOW QUALITY PROTEIN: hypothetical protein HID58_043842 [Brassica napus]|uniref:Transposase-associated domain-containing protein n=1 Tax=Brassica napus TaxID=3708 RepID=A0ABQ8BHN0_BRANA|nr:LOW QUALITY PROTEIN: hypothetical protein HID58_043842 [Brassica napus]